ncbi:cytochrome c oxidase subunit II [Methylocaldum sp.]|uniref:cytochrome c oxidase subunit II n=1 Tax=Methylocaldum sp. TaxID=1969727 RepID=UPI002D4A3406|nr:cytochrome c oxidase subunit II [Methylocaldum sp.]HYE34580.1 cytochrome c oxidase subunit II [Methylocaldum sp.]
MAGTDAVSDTPLLPQASTLAERVDALFFTLVGVDVLMVLVLSGLIIGFAVYYRRSARVNRTTNVPETKTEIIWSLGLLTIFLAIFVWAAHLYVTEENPPRNALEIHAIGKQWMWKFEHRNGQREINELHVPLGLPVKVVLATQDVIHSFFVPAFRAKQDVVPGRYRTVWFTPSRIGRYHLFCAEYCGLDHSRMRGQVIVMEPAEYEAWLAGDSGAESLPVQGEKLFSSLGCIICHGAGSKVAAPSLAGIFGKPVPLTGGQTVVADETYIRDSILMPEEQVVSGYEPIMPSFVGRVDQSDLTKLIAYIKSLSREEARP